MQDQEFYAWKDGKTDGRSGFISKHGNQKSVRMYAKDREMASLDWNSPVRSSAGRVMAGHVVCQVNLRVEEVVWDGNGLIRTQSVSSQYVTVRICAVHVTPVSDLNSPRRVMSDAAQWSMSPCHGIIVPGTVHVTVSCAQSVMSDPHSHVGSAQKCPFRTSCPQS